jgi:hypothetical protein
LVVVQVHAPQIPPEQVWVAAVQPERLHAWVAPDVQVPPLPPVLQVGSHWPLPAQNWTPPAPHERVEPGVQTAALQLPMQLPQPLPALLQVSTPYDGVDPVQPGTTHDLGCPGKQVVGVLAQPPAMQTGYPEGQTRPQTRQLAGSVCRSTHVLPQSVSPAPHAGVLLSVGVASVPASVAGVASVPASVPASAAVAPSPGGWSQTMSPAQPATMAAANAATIHRTRFFM